MLEKTTDNLLIQRAHMQQESKEMPCIPFKNKGIDTGRYYEDCMTCPFFEKWVIGKCALCDPPLALEMSGFTDHCRSKRYPRCPVYLNKSFEIHGLGPVL